MLTQKVYSTIKRYHLIGRNDRVLVGVSGGPDSVALLLILNQLKNKLGVRLFVAHLNHGLRPEAKKEELFVRLLAAKLKLPAVTKRRKIIKIGSLEEDARLARYEFFQQAAKIVNADKIALAHTKDDQAETVLMRLLRGAGLSGLAAIPKVRSLGKLKVIRPLIEVNKSEVIKFLQKKKQKYFIDKTNLEDKYFRNRVRNRLLPDLEKYNQNIRQILANTADNLSLDYAFLREIAQKRFNRVKRSVSAHSVRLDLRKLRQEHLAVQRLIIRLCIEKLIKDTRRITYRHWQEIESLLANLPDGSVVNLPKSISVKKMPSCIILALRKT